MRERGNRAGMPCCGRRMREGLKIARGRGRAGGGGGRGRGLASCTFMNAVALPVLASEHQE